MGGRRWLLIVPLLAALAIDGDLQSPAYASEAASKATVLAHMESLPLRFEANHGQVDEQVSFVARAPGYDLFLTDAGPTFAFRAGSGAIGGAHEPIAKSGAIGGAHEPIAKSGDEAESAVVRMRVVGGRSVKPSPSNRLPGSSNYFVGAAPSNWRTGIESYARVRYLQVLPGVDVVYYGAKPGRLEYDIVLAPRVDANGIELAFDGVRSIELDRNGDALLRLPSGREVIQGAPLAYQIDAWGKREPVHVRYVRKSGGLGFEVGPHEGARALVVDPTLTYSTYLGGLSSDGAFGVAVDASGSAYIAGTTSSTNFPGASFPQSATAGNYHCFVTKLNPAGSAIVYSTYIGGSGGDFANGIAIDAAGEAFVTGATSSTNFPTAAPLSGTFGGVFDAFVTKLDAAGSALVYSTYVGGSGNDQARAIAIDSAGDAFITGFTYSTDFPTRSPLQSANLATSGTAFVAVINPAGSAFDYSTYLGGSTQDSGSGIAVDSAGEAVVVGATSSSNFPTSAPLQGTYMGGPGDAFVAKLNAGGSALVYSTYLGGTAADTANGVALDAAGDALVVGTTASDNFPTASAAQSFRGGPQDAFVAEISAAGSAFVYSTYLGGSSADFGQAVAVDTTGDAIVVGYTSSTDFPVLSAWQSANAGKEDVFVTSFGVTGSILYSSYLGGSDNEQGNGITVNATGAVVVGETASTNFPVAAAMQAAEGGGDDAFIVKISEGATTAAPVVPALGSRVALLLAAILLLIGARNASCSVRA